MYRLCIVFCLFCFTTFNSAQVIGKIFDRGIADQEFGNVISFIEIESADIDSLLQNLGTYIMVNIDNGKIRIIDSERKSILGQSNSNEEVFYKFSTSKVEELINIGQKEITFVEMRPNTLTLTNGDFTLEMSLPCPPFCGN